MRDLDAKESVYRKARVAADAAQKASVAAAHEQSAVDGFPALAKKIGDELRAVYSKVGQGQWAEAESLRAQALEELNSVQDTSVSSTKAWTDLRSRVVALQSKIQPQLDRIAQQEATRQQAAAAAAQEKSLKANAISDWFKRTIQLLSGKRGRCRRQVQGPYVARHGHRRQHRQGSVWRASSPTRYAKRVHVHDVQHGGFREVAGDAVVEGGYRKGVVHRARHDVG